MKLTHALLILILLAPVPAAAQQMNHDHMAAMKGGAGMPAETGQSAFAAIQEIVGILNANPATDWSKVDIEALRQHLIDMNNVTLGAKVVANDDAGSVRFLVSGEGEVRESVRRMVMAHAATMNGQEGWGFAAETTPDGASLTVTPPDAAQMAKLKALGFIGILTLGMHHQAHHLMIAAGHSPH
jgi:hypothetical protein